MTARLLTAHVVADRLGLSTETVLRWARAGDLPAIHLSNRAIRFPEDQLEAWLQDRATPAPGGATQPVPAPPVVGMVTDATRRPRRQQPPGRDPQVQ